MEKRAGEKISKNWGHEFYSQFSYLFLPIEQERYMDA